MGGHYVHLTLLDLEERVRRDTKADAVGELMRVALAKSTAATVSEVLRARAGLRSTRAVTATR
jgi:hypothetical protein